MCWREGKCRVQREELEEGVGYRVDVLGGVGGAVGLLTCWRKCGVLDTGGREG
jgi:hypothetical protein